ncbi:MAG: sigma-E processing peptidase SpoIIGA [Christensenellales bacterium]
MVKVYIEYVFFDNAVMNYIILLLAGRLLHCNKKTWRYILSASIGALYATAALVCPFLNIFLFKIALMPAITLCAFGFFCIKRFLQNMAGILIITLAMGGAMMGLFYFTGLGGYLQGAVLMAFPLRIMVAGGFVMFFLLSSLRKWIAGRSKAETLFRVAFGNQENTEPMAALIDTANTLKDPISGLPVALIHDSVARKLLGDNVVNAMLNKEIPTGWEERARIIPFHALESAGVLLVLKPASACVFLEDWRDVEIYIGIHNGGLKKLGCKALLPACMNS